MPHADVGTTHPSQLRAVRDWEDHEAWLCFQDSYDPLVRCCCASLELKGADFEEDRQVTWIEVAKRMQAFIYDPNGSFRGWLWKVCNHKAMDLINRKKRDSMFPFDERIEWVRSRCNSGRFIEADVPTVMTTVEPGGRFLSDLSRQAEEIQAIVKRRVEPRTWEAFWLVGVSLWTVEETADHLRMSLASVYKAKERVLKALQAEGRNRAVGTNSRGEVTTGG